MGRRDWSSMRRVFRLPFSGRRLSADVDAELGFHLEGRVEELMGQGMSRSAAEAEARRRFGDYARIESEVARLDRGAERRRSFADRVDALVADLRRTMRMLARQRLFSMVVIGTLTLGIAATTAMFHAVDRAVLHPLPYPHADRIVYLGWQRLNGGGVGALSARKFEFWRAQSRVFDGLATSRTFEALAGDDPASPTIKGIRVTQDYLHVLGIPPMLGRAFVVDDYTPAATPAAILSYNLWSTQFGADPAVIGRQIRLDTRPYTIVGVMPASFEIVDAPEWSQVLVPLAFTPAQLADGGNNYMVIGRLRNGVTAERVAADMAAVFQRYATTYSDKAQKEDLGVRLRTYQSMLGDLPRTLWMMLGATVFVLLLACANVANLLLARALSRQREFAVRAALGAGRGRIVRQVMLETLVLGLVAAVFATAASLAAVRGVVSLASGTLMRQSQLGLDPRVLAYTTVVAIATSLVIGLFVALLATRVDLAKSLAEGGRSGALGRRQRALRNALVSTESAVAMLLLSAAGLLIASFARVNGVDPGYARDGVFTASLTRRPAGYDSPRAVWHFQQQVLEQLRATPGIVSVGATSSLPLVRGWNLAMTVEGRADASEGGLELRSVSPGYLDTFGVRVVAGRDFRDSDDGGAPGVVIVSESFARFYWPNESAIGHRILLGQFRGRSVGPAFNEPAREVIGVVPDLRDMSLEQDQMQHTAWVPQAQVITPLVRLPAFAVRATDARVAATALRKAIAVADSRVGEPTIAAMNDVVSVSLAWRRFNLVLMTIFALLALSLTCVGIYGVVAYSAAQRVQEIGVRMALGAHPRSVIALVVADGMRPALVGLAVGLAGALALSRVIVRYLYGVSPHDPVSLGSVAAVLTAVAFAASYVPARRASRVDPLTALRAE